jgi:diadenosine tetraphosphatase ApaH/serine/threonine PP2A family protein phosphatase
MTSRYRQVYADWQRNPENFWAEAAREIDWINQSEIDYQLPAGQKALVNVGSVGQPRDGDARASYAILDLSKSTVEFRRVAYDIAAARRRTEAAMLPDVSATRLALGA